MQRPEDSYGGLISSLEALGVSWAVAGAWAAFRYRATDRVTTDADFLISWHADVVEAIRQDGWEVRTAADPGDTPHLIRARRPAEAVDFLVALTGYQQEALRRATDHVLTVEDVLVHKIIAWRKRDRDDIESILAAGHEIDWAYVRQWVEFFGFEKRFDEVKRFSG